MSLATLALETKVIAGLALALVLSLGANVLQLRAAWVGEGKAQGQAARESLAAANESLTRDAAINAGIAKTARIDATGLLSRLDAIADRGEQVRVIYRTAAARTPLAANCAPGTARVDSINQGLAGAAAKDRR